ncbi:hypothetical protein D8S82_17500 [Mycobacterium hodleri]|uniref:DUF3263 domain-containing protein n=1 Tax=Mycolicibacterium hodleri TaxID=49897 RepID=A0A544VZ02_9MYCO|nr:hypothetical protein [Mycolicibacterium hodleri]TQR85215.1 hypothetical protein D8S82_17500 [Mycolicibacterium hodleri]
MANGFIADRFAHDIVTFMRNWAPYGGPPADEVLPEFGLTRDQLVMRYQEIMTAAAARRAPSNRPSPGRLSRPTNRRAGD